MWFNNLIVYQYQTPLATNLEEIQNALEEHRLRPCPPHARISQGFTNPLADHDEKIYSIYGCHVLVAAKETRLLPSAVIHDILEEKMADFETVQLRAMSRAEKLQLKEETEFELLPKAFTVQKKDWLYIDTLNQWIVINTANANKASDILSLLIKALGSIGISPLTVEMSLSHLFAGWLNQTIVLPPALAIGKRCVLINSKDDKSQYNCKDIEQNIAEITTLLEQGYCVSSIEMAWQDRVQFTITDNFLFKKVGCMDYLQDTVDDNRKLENAQEKFDANFSLLVGEVRELIKFLLKQCRDDQNEIFEHKEKDLAHA